MKDLIVTNARIVARNEIIHGDLIVRDGRIGEMGRSSKTSAATNAVDFNGDFLLPGLVELHTDNLEHAATPRPGVCWPAGSAVVAHDAQMAACGVTTIFDAIAVGDVQRGGDRLSRLDSMVDAITIAQNAGALRSEHRLHLRCELSHSGLEELMLRLGSHPLVGLVSLMDHTPGQRQFLTLEQFKIYYQGKYGLSDEDLATFITDRRRDQELYAGPNRAMVISLAQELGVKLASHDDATPAHIDEAVEAGVAIAEFPTTREAAAAARAAGLSILGGAPNVVRGVSHSGNASALEFARAGLLDILSSDYVPISLLYGAFRLADETGVPLNEAVAKVTANPAASVGLNDRGILDGGMRADLVRVRVVDGLPIARAVWRAGERIA